MVTKRNRQIAFVHRCGQPHRRGFVLVLVLVMLALITFTMTRLSSHSLRQAQIAATAERTMQHRWRTLSIQRLALRRAPDLLRQLDLRTPPGTAAQRSNDTYVSYVDFRVEVATHAYHIRVADESAKLPIGALLEQYHADVVFDASQKLLSPNLRFRASDPGTLIPRPHHFSQIFDVGVNASSTDLSIGKAASEDLTLWGPGKLGLQRSSPESIDALWRILFKRPAPTRLHELRAGTQVPGDLIAQLGLRESETELANQWFTTRSNHYSIWIIPVPNTGEPTRFCINWGSEPHISHQAIEY